MSKTLPALKARSSSFRRHDVLSISKPAEGLKGGEVGLFWDQEIGLELLRRANAYPKLVETLRNLREQCDTRLLFSGGSVKAIREAGKFLKALDATDALLNDLGRDA